MDFLKENQDYDLDVYFCVLSDDNFELGKKVLSDLCTIKIESSMFDLNEAERILIFQKFITILQTIEWDEDLKNWCRYLYNKTSAAPVKNAGIYMMLDVLHEQVYKSHILLVNYGDVIDSADLDHSLIDNPTDEFLAKLTKEQILACITAHFRADHSNNGYLIQTAVAEGFLLKLMKAYLERDGV